MAQSPGSSYSALDATLVAQGRYDELASVPKGCSSSTFPSCLPPACAANSACQAYWAARVPRPPAKRVSNERRRSAHRFWRGCEKRCADLNCKTWATARPSTPSPRSGNPFAGALLTLQPLSHDLGLALAGDRHLASQSAWAESSCDDCPAAATGTPPTRQSTSQFSHLVTVLPTSTALSPAASFLAGIICSTEEARCLFHSSSTTPQLRVAATRSQ